MVSRKKLGGREYLSINDKYEGIEEKYDGVKELMNLGKEKGYLLYDEVNDALPDDIKSSKDLDSIFYLFGDAGIEVIDSKQQLEVGEQKMRPKAEEAEATDLIAESFQKTHDPFRMYVREMGRTALLTREGEVEIAKRIEKGQRTVIKALSHSPVVIAEILKYGENLKKDELTIKNLVAFNKDERTDEILGKRRRKVLRRINEIGALEAEATKIRKRLSKSKKNSRAYKRLLSQLARYRIPMARTIRDLGLTPQVHQGLVNVVKAAVDRIVTLEWESKKLKKLQESPLKPDEAKKVKLRLREIDKEMKEIEDEVLASPAELKRTLAAIKQGELEAEIAKKELVEANLRLVVSIAKKYTHRG
ncbi:RNA polymerase sigma factor RpoD, partial [Acidobacteria bacterium AH-259-A15]|nr:RNA polymerase sigma factor RpoD [Acidobacteria bacterium AH-259-A15]